MGDALPWVDLGAGRTVKAIAPGNRGTCAVLDNDTVKCWGSNEYGELGAGHKKDGVGYEPNHMGDALPIVNLGAGRRGLALSRSIQNGRACAVLD